MAQGKDMTTTVSIAGSIDPSLQKSIASAQKSVKGLGTSLKAIGGITLGVAAAGVAAITSAAIVASKTIYDIGKKFDEASDKIRVGTGASGKDLKELNNSFKEVYKHVDDDSAVVSQAIADINTLTGATGKPLEALAERSLKASKMLGIDSAALIAPATKAFNAFNVSGMDMADTLDYAWKVSQSTGTGMDKLFQTVIDNSSTFKNLNYDIKGAMSLIGKLDKSGIESTKVFAGMSKGIAFFSEKGFKSASEGFSVYYSKIKDARTETEAFNIAGKVFGKRGAGVMVQSIRSGNMEIGDFVKAMGQSSESILKCYEDISDLGEIMAEVWHNIEVLLAPLGEVFFDQFQKIGGFLKTQLKSWEPDITKAINSIKPVIEKWTNDIISFLSHVDFTPVIKGFEFLWKYREPIGLVVGALGGFAAILAVVTAAQWAFNIAMAANPIGLAVIAIAAVIAGVVLLIYYWDEVKAAFLRVNDWLTEKLGSWKYLILGLCSPIGAVALYCIEHWDEVCAFFSSAWESIKAAWTSGCDVLSRLWDACFKLVVAVFREVLALFGVEWDEFLAYWQAAGEIIKNQWAAVCAFFTSENSRFVQVANAIRDGFISAFQGVKDFVMGVIIYIRAQLESLISTITGFTAGIKGMGGSIRKAFQAVNPFGGSDSSLPAKAAGGFVTGPSLCGEAGTEAVISFDPRYRDANRGYLMTAAEMLGMSAAPARETRQNVVTYDVGGITFAPVIKAEGGDGGQDIMRQLRNCIPELMDMIEDALQQRNGGRYA